MRVEYSKRAITDLRKIAAYYRDSADARASQAVERHIREVVDHIGRSPESAPRVVQQAAVRVALVLRYPCKIFYRVIGNTIRIVHIRHTARRPWTAQ